MTTNHLSGKTTSTAEKQMRIMPKDFEQVTLTKEEEEYAIYDARCGKYFEEKIQKEKALKAKEIMECFTPFSTAELREYVLKNNSFFKVDEQNEKVFEQLCQYFTGDPEFEKDGLKLSKGLLLTGGVGVGKTEMLQVFSKNKRQCFQLISVFKIEAFCQKNGVENFHIYTGMIPGWGNTADCFYQKAVGWCFDDIGRESMVFDFGNKSDVVSRIIQTRYMNKQTLPFNTLHLTTNLTAVELEAKYDYAVKSRLREMFNYIPMYGKDRR